MAEKIKKVNEEMNQEQEVNQENTTPETPAEEEKKEGVLSKLKRFGSEKVVPTIKATGKVVGKMAIITGGILGAALSIGFVAGMTVKNQNEYAEDDNDEESASGGDEEIDELLNGDDSEDEEDNDESAEE